MRFTGTIKKAGPIARLLTAALARRARQAEDRPFDPHAARAESVRFAERLPLARGVTASKETIAGVPVVRFSSGGGARGTVLAFHGGAYVTGSPLSLSIPVAKNGGPDVISVDYRMSPEHPYPAGHQDALAVYRALLDTVGAQRLAVMGDSAGGGLALTLLQGAAAEGLPMPAALVAAFPWGDLSMSGPSSTTNRGRDVLVHSQIVQAAAWYADGRDLQDPAISPLFGSFSGFPPTYLFIGTRDLILDDSRRMADKMRREGVDVHLDVFPDAPHGFNAVPFPAGRQANRRARSFLNSRLPAVPSAGG